MMSVLFYCESERNTWQPNRTRHFPAHRLPTHLSLWKSVTNQSPQSKRHGWADVSRTRGAPGWRQIRGSVWGKSPYLEPRMICQSQLNICISTLHEFQETSQIYLARRRCLEETRSLWDSTASRVFLDKKEGWVGPVVLASFNFGWLVHFRFGVLGVGFFGVLFGLLVFF